MHTESLKAAHKFLDDMADEAKPKKHIAMPKWMIQGLIYGTILALVLFTVGTMAVGLMPGLFPANYGLILGAIGFIGSIGIAYTKDIVE